MEYLHHRHFSLRTARNVVLQIVPLVAELVNLKRRLDALGYDLYRHQYFGGSGPNGEKAYPPELERLVAIAQELDSRGILIKDLDKGLIDFPCLRENGEEVYLCWMLGEPDIGYWHRIADGFEGRIPISEL